MGDSSNKENSEVKAKSGIKALKTELKKIMWPTKDALIKKSLAVFCAATALALLIALVDYLVKSGLDKLLG